MNNLKEGVIFAAYCQDNIFFMIFWRSALGDLQSDPAEATLGSALSVQKGLHFIVAFSIQPRLRRHYPGAQFHPHSQYSSEYRTAHPGYTQKAGRLINLIDSGVGWNIQHLTIPYHLYNRR
jgi:hypothetical protein